MVMLHLICFISGGQSEAVTLIAEYNINKSKKPQFTWNMEPPPSHPPLTRAHAHKCTKAHNYEKHSSTLFRIYFSNFLCRLLFPLSTSQLRASFVMRIAIFFG